MAGAPIKAGFGEAERAEAAARTPAQKGAAGRVQRYWNPRTSRMEAMGQHGHLIGNENIPHGGHPVPPGHNVSHTTTTTTREGQSSARPQVSFLNKTPQEIEALARSLTQADVRAAQGPFREQYNLYGNEQAAALGRNTELQGKLGTTLQGLQTAQGVSAKTNENYAADAVTKASQAAPGAAQTAERLGLKPGEQLPESARNQQEAARTLLTGIASASQAGTLARQQSEENFLTNLRGSAAQGGVETGRAIEGQFGKQRADVLGKQAAAVGKIQEGEPSLAQKLFGEQEKLKIAAGGLGIKQEQTGINRFKAVTTAENQRAQRRGEGAKIAQGNRRNEIGLMNANTNRLKAVNDIQYKNATLAEKQRVDSAKIGDLTNKIKVAYARLGSKGTKTSQAQVNKGTQELAVALNAFATGPGVKGKGGKESGRNYGAIRQHLISGNYQTTEVGGKERGYKGPQATNATILNAAEQIYRYHYVNAATKAALKNMGMPSEGLSNLLASLYK